MGLQPAACALHAIGAPGLLLTEGQDLLLSCAKLMYAVSVHQQLTR